MALFTYIFFVIIIVVFLILCIGEGDISAKRLYAIIAGCAAFAMLYLL